MAELVFLSFKDGLGAPLELLDYRFVNEAEDTFEEYNSITSAVTEPFEDYGGIA